MIRLDMSLSGEYDDDSGAIKESMKVVKGSERNYIEFPKSNFYSSWNLTGSSGQQSSWLPMMIPWQG